MANDIKILIQAIVKGEQETRGLADLIDSGFKRGKLAIEAFNAATGNGRTAIQNLNLGVKDLVATYLSIAGAKAAFSGMVDILKQGEQAQFNMTASVQAASREFQNTGSLTFWEGAVKDLSKELVVYSESSLKGAVSRTVDMTKRLGLSTDQMKELIKRTADLSAGKTDLEGGIERVTAAMRGEAEASEFLGLTLNEDYVKAWYEANKQHEKAWKDLTDLEKAQVRYQIFLEQTSAFQGRAAESSKTFQGALMLVDKAINDAVMNNKDLGEAMSEVAQFIRENADSIGDLASDLITLTAKVAQFALEWKEVFLALGAVWGITKAVSFLSTVITGLGAAMKVLQATRATSVMLEMAAASNAARVAGVALSTWMTRFLIVAATMAAQQIWRLVDAYRELKKWEEVAKEATKDRLAIEETANKKAQELGQQIGVNISSLADFNRLVKEGKLVWDDQTQSWKKATEASKDQAKAVELSEAKMKEVRSTLQDLGSAYDLLRSRVGAYFDFAAQKVRAMTSDERSGMTAAIDIQRQKMTTLLQLAEQEARQKSEVLRQSGASEAQAADDSKQIAEGLKNARIDALKGWESYLQSALLTAINEEKKYAAEVERLQGHLVDIHSRGEDRIRDLSRRTMTEGQQYLDKQKQAYETLAKAKEAMARADTPEGLKKAEDLAKKAEDQFASLAGAVKEGDKVIVSEAKSVADATKGINEAIKVQEEAVKQQIETTKQLQEQRTADIKAYETELDGVKTKLDELAATEINPTMTVKVDTSAADAAIARLQQPTSSTHTVIVETVEKSQAGGQAGRFADGGWPRRAGKLPGWGGGDHIRALLEAGEFIIRKEAVAKYGAGLFHMLNGMRINLADIFSAALDVPSLPPSAAYAAGGSVSAPVETITWRHQVGDVEIPIQVMGAQGRDMIKALEKALGKKRLTKGR